MSNSPDVGPQPAAWPTPPPPITAPDKPLSPEEIRTELKRLDEVVTKILPMGFNKQRIGRMMYSPLLMANVNNSETLKKIKTDYVAMEAEYLTANGGGQPDQGTPGQAAVGAVEGVGDHHSSMTIAAAAQQYLAGGISVVPTRVVDKKPICSWKPYQSTRMASEEVPQHFAGADSVAAIGGAVSGNLECIDFDFKAEAFDAWSKLVETAQPGLLARLTIQKTQSGGRHVVYRSTDPVEGSQDLCYKLVEVSGEGEHSYGNKKLKAKKIGDKWFIQPCLIETRGEGGYFLCAPSPGYELRQGAFDQLATLTSPERELLLRCTVTLSAVPPNLKPPNAPPSVEGQNQDGSFIQPSVADDAPGSDYNACGYDHLLSVLEGHGWTRLGQMEDGSLLLQRPGKDGNGHSAVLHPTGPSGWPWFYNFSSNADPFEANRGYRLFSVYTALEHAGDFSKAASALRKQGYGGDLPSMNGASSAVAMPTYLSPLQMEAKYPKEQEFVVTNLLRRGEVGNLVAAPKTHKSYAVLDLAANVVTGGRWFGFQCRQGRVLILDYELFPATINRRLKAVLDAQKRQLADVDTALAIESLRGRQLDVRGLKNYFEKIKPQTFDLVVLDPLYRIYPASPEPFDENSNADMSALMCWLTVYARYMDAAFMCVHHSSKGVQGDKRVSDMGAGAGAQSRAVDAHLILREHEEDHCFVFDGLLRSVAPLTPVVLRWDYPGFKVDPSLDPAKLRMGGRRDRGQVNGGASNSKTAMTAELLVRAFVTNTPKARSSILAEVAAAGHSERNAKNLLNLAVNKGLIYAHPGHKGAILYATVPPTKSAA